MYKGLRVAVVVPAHNESAHIASVIETMPELVDHIVVIDDLSPDDTYAVASTAADTRTEVIRHEMNKGVGGAVITGHRRALELGADVSVVMAGDGQMDPDYLPALLDPIADDGYGFSKANRFFSMNSFQGMPKHRVFGNMVLTFMTKAASGYWDLVDPQNGYTAITRKALESIPLHRIAERYEFENDLLIWLNIAGVRSIDVPIPAVYGNEVSGMRLHIVAPRIFGALVGGFWRRIWMKYVIWSFNPIALLMFAGIPLVVLGLAVGIWAVAVSASSPGSVTTGTWLLAVAPALLGTQLLLQAWQLDIQATPK